MKHNTADLQSPVAASLSQPARTQSPVPASPSQPAGTQSPVPALMGRLASPTASRPGLCVAWRGERSLQDTPHTQHVSPSQVLMVFGITKVSESEPVQVLKLFKMHARGAWV